METPRKTFKAVDSPKLERIHEAARELVPNHLDQPCRRIREAGYSDLEVAYAFISFGYHLLRQRRTEKHALSTFRVLAEFALRKLEEGRSRFMATKLN